MQHRGERVDDQTYQETACQERPGPGERAHVYRDCHCADISTIPFALRWSTQSSCPSYCRIVLLQNVDVDVLRGRGVSCLLALQVSALQSPYVLRGRPGPTEDRDDLDPPSPGE